MKDLGKKVENNLISANFSIEEFSNIFPIEGLNVPSILFENIKELYFELKEATSCTDTTLALCIILFVNYSQKENEKKVEINDFKKIKQGLKDLDKLEKQISVKIKEFKTKYPNLDFELKTNFSKVDISNLSEEELSSRIESYSNLVNKIETIIPPQRKLDDYYSNLFQVKVRYAIELHKNEVWPTFFAVINIFKKYYPDFLVNIENELTMQDKDTLRKRLQKFEKYYPDNNTLQSQKKLARGARKDKKK
ncbi:hypothetical protein [Halobacteriovorax sp. ZH5_bin.2]|uniref:hypothetical protein n=1 Tax=Halobacteriovorax sp. ZH5_bin.2 TaxID=3157727 RepID=UPI003717C772